MIVAILIGLAAVIVVGTYVVLVRAVVRDLWNGEDDG